MGPGPDRGTTPTNVRRHQGPTGVGLQRRLLASECAPWLATSVLTAATQLDAIGAGITAGAGTGLVLQCYSVGGLDRPIAITELKAQYRYVPSRPQGL